MTAQELRNLITAVEEAGGPITSEDRDGGEFAVFAEGADFGYIVRADGSYFPGGDDDKGLVEDGWIGALKRDLVERGYSIDIRITGHDATAQIWNPDTTHNISYCDGCTELEALLDAWVSAAQFERWGEAGEGSA